MLTVSALKLISALLLVKSTIAGPMRYGSRFDVVERRGCAMSISDEDRLATEWTLDAFRQDLSTRGIVNKTEGLKPVSFDVYWHVIYANETKEGGYVSDEQIQQQMKVLNDDFKSANISWNFKNTTRIENEDWFLSAAPGTPQEQEMKAQYHKGDSTALNIFTAQFNATTKSLGFASLPSSYLRDPISDGLIIRHTTLPGGAHTNYNQGRTTVHEAGHWLGLYHTFEGGCTGVGDNIDDTAPEASESVGCPVGRKSCPDAKEVDPIHNFMDYSFDSCMTHFTPGQAVRMHEVIWAFRTKRPPVANSTGPRTSSVAAKHTMASTSVSSATGSLDLEAFPTGVVNDEDGYPEDDDGQEYFEEDD